MTTCTRVLADLGLLVSIYYIIIQLYVYTYKRGAFRGISFANVYTHTHIMYTQRDLKQTKTFLWTYAGEHRFMLYMYTRRNHRS